MGCARLVYNRALAYRTEAWYSRQERVGYKESSAMLTALKRENDFSFLNEVSCVPLQQGLRHLQKAFTNFFAGRAKYPRFKKKRNGGSAEFTKSAFKWHDGQICLAKCSKPLPIRWSRQIPKGSEPSTVTVKLTPTGRWYVSLLVDVDIEPLEESPNAIGVDLGLTSLIATSDGEKAANPKTFSRLHRKLARAQKVLARKVKGSNNRHKARIKVARIQETIANARKDFLHKLTTQLVRENQTIAVEDLAVKNMQKNRKLAKHISDASWGELVRQLEYKCAWYGRQFVRIDRWFPSSKRCSDCGHVVDRLPLDIRQWSCPQCGSTHDRDINAAINILAAGHAVSACGVAVRPIGHESKRQARNTRKRKKQEPLG